MIDYKNIRRTRNCVVWTRVSTKYQEDNGGSLQSQKECCEEYAKQHGYTIVKYCGGKHESAKTPGAMVREMYGYVKKHKEVGTILVSEFDRFSRTSWQATKMLEELRELGVIVVATKFGLNTETKEGMLMAQQTLSMAQWDNQTRTDKFVDGRANCLRSGAWCEKAPMGYNKEGKSRETFCYLNETGKLIRKAFKWKLNGDANTTILYRLETLGLKISAQTLHKILVNPFYAGKIVHKLIKGEMVDGKIEPTISYTEFLKVQDILSGRTGKYAHKKENDRCPLTKYVICSEDGTPFTSYTKKKKEREFNYYKCNTSGCKTNISAKEMHEKYEDILNQYDLPECVLRQFESTLREELQVYQKESLDERKRLKKMLTEADNEIKNMKVRYATGKIDEDIYEVAIREMQNRKDVLTLELEKCNDNLSNLEAQIPVVIATACKLGTLWHDGNLETKRKIQNLVYPNGIYWDKAKRCYRTQNRNKFFDILDRYSISYGKEKGTSSDEDVPLCGRRESNPYASRHQILSLACLPISTRPQQYCIPFLGEKDCKCTTIYRICKFKKAQ